MAKRLAKCRQEGVQLECGDCGHEEVVPTHCNSRLCEVCGRRRKGQLIGKWLRSVEAMDDPTLMTLTVENVVLRTPEDLEEARSGLLDDFATLRRRVIPTEGETVREGQRKRWVWRSDGGEPASTRWRQSLGRAAASEDRGRRQLEAARLEAEYVREGRGIPFTEVVKGGLAGMDIKQQEGDEFNIHLHAVCDVSFVPQEALSAVWEDVTGSPVVDLRRIEESRSRDAEDALMEVVGYAVKTPEFETLDDEIEYVVQLKGKNLVVPFGSLHGNASDPAPLVCSGCENVPFLWHYLGVVDAEWSTVDVRGGSATDGDRPPDEAGV